MDIDVMAVELRKLMEWRARVEAERGELVAVEPLTEEAIREIANEVVEARVDSRSIKPYVESDDGLRRTRHGL